MLHRMLTNFDVCVCVRVCVCVCVCVRDVVMVCVLVWCFVDVNVSRMIKPIWGFVSDTYPVLGEKRRPYFIIASIIAFAGYFAVASALYSSEGNVYIYRQCMLMSSCS